MCGSNIYNISWSILSHFIKLLPYKVQMEVKIPDVAELLPPMVFNIETLIKWVTPLNILPLFLYVYLLIIHKDCHIIWRKWWFNLSPRVIFIISHYFKELMLDIAPVVFLSVKGQVGEKIYLIFNSKASSIISLNLLVVEILKVFNYRCHYNIII